MMLKDDFTRQKEMQTRGRLSDKNSYELEE